MACQIAGFHWVDIEPEGAHIKSLWVHENNQRQDVARELKNRGESWAKERGANSMKTCVHSANKRMMAFNLKCGFQPSWVTMTKKL